MSDKQEHILLFNKKHGILIGRIDSKLKEGIDSDKFIIKTVSMGTNEYYYGDYATGKVISTDEKPYISEKDIRFYTSADILGIYPYHKQLNIILEMLEKSSIEKTTEFDTMMQVLRPLREKANLQMQAFKNSNAFSYYSEEHDKELLKKRYDL